MSKNNIIVYLHGFRSSPASHKARLCEHRMVQLNAGDRYFCPQLPASPIESIQLIESILRPYDPGQITLIGSSLGGYYATWLAEKTGCRAVLLNPMTHVPDDMMQYVGTTTSFHSDEPFEFKREYIDDLKAMHVPHITRPARYFLIAATGDELLNWQDMAAHYPGARQIIIAGSDHSLTGFEEYLDEVLAFGGIVTGATA